MGWDPFETVTACLPYSNHGSLTPGPHERLDVGNSREEPGAGKPQARIYEGKAEWPSYSNGTLMLPKPGS